MKNKVRNGRTRGSSKGAVKRSNKESRTGGTSKSLLKAGHDPLALFYDDANHGMAPLGHIEVVTSNSPRSDEATDLKWSLSSFVKFLASRTRGTRRRDCVILFFLLGGVFVAGRSSSSSANLQSSVSSLIRSTFSASSSLDFSLEDLESVEPIDPVRDRKKVLVTGGAGFIGSHVAEALLSRGDQVVVVDEMNDFYDVHIKETNLKLLQERAAESDEHKRVLRDKHSNSASSDDEKHPASLMVYRGDIADDSFMAKIFDTERPDYVCHMAARAGVRASISDTDAYIHANVQGTTKVLEMAIQYGVKNFVYASSSSVYGGSSHFSESESADRPTSPYGATKKSSELIAHTFHHLYGLNTTGLRFFNVYGPRGRPDMVPFTYMDHISRSNAILQIGDGSSTEDFTYISDIVDGVLRSIDRHYGFQIMNLGKGASTSLRDMLSVVEKHMGKKAIVEVVPDQPGDGTFSLADIHRAEKLLGYQPKVDLDDGVRRTVEWYNATIVKELDLQAPPSTHRNKKKFLRRSRSIGVLSQQNQHG